jgi:hypothetical protein
MNNMPVVGRSLETSSDPFDMKNNIIRVRETIVTLFGKFFVIKLCAVQRKRTKLKNILLENFCGSYSVKFKLFQKLWLR